MKQKLIDMTSERVEEMIMVKWGKLVHTPHEPSFVAYSAVGKIFGMDGSSVRRLVMHHFKDLARR